MAYKTPGIYFNEIDNTSYINPASSISTTVAIIGFARKGPIGIPVEITRYDDFKKTFGTPISGQYAGLAVLSVLSAGGVVLYTRIADESKVSRSNVVIKKETESTKAAIVINRTSSNITLDEDTLGKSFGCKINGKNIVVRTPSTGSLGLQSLAKQIYNSLNDESSRDEFEVLSTTASKETISDFVITSKTTDNSDAPKASGTYYVNILKGDTISDITNKIKTAISLRPNAYYKADFSSEAFGDNIDISGGDYISENNAKFIFGYKTGTGPAISKQFSIKATPKEGDNDYTIKKTDLINALNECFYDKNNDTQLAYVFEKVENNKSSLYFISANKDSFELAAPASNEGTKVLFGEASEANSTALLKYTANSESKKEKPKTGYLTLFDEDSNKGDIKVEYDSERQIIIFSSPTKYSIEVSGSIVNGSIIGAEIKNQVKETAVTNLEVKIPSGKKQIRITSEDGSSLTIAESDESSYGSLISLLGGVGSTEVTESDITNENKIFKVAAEEGIDASHNDIVVFTAKEYGEVDNVGVRVYTSVSPIDGSKTHYIETVVGGIIKETWEEVSYDPSSERYFKNLINEEPENAGSEYLKVTVIKNNPSTEVALPDTSELTGSDAPIYVGKPINDNSVNRADTKIEGTDRPVGVTSYTDYDYMVGDNGFTEESDDLFTEAMNTETSGLSNKDLYYWHILITPDNISETVQDCAIKFCEFMEDAIYIADPPQGISRDSVIKWHNGAFGRGSAIQSDYACTYWPWLKVYDSNEAKYVWCMPSVLMAAQFCKVDNNYNPWYAPAGETNGLISQAVDLETYPNKADRDAMYLDQNRVNPFLMMKNGNILAYGEKTLKRKNSTLTKIHTRRMLIALKHELRNSIKGFIFLPTAAENISNIRSIATSIMERVKSGGGVSSYRVVCDGSNNTTETLQQDILNLDITCVPTGCLEQIEINFTLNKNES